MADSRQNILSRVKHWPTSNIVRFDVDAVSCDYHKLDNRADTDE
jgi:hypothetical protein